MTFSTALKATAAHAFGALLVGAFIVSVISALISFGGDLQSAAGIPAGIVFFYFSSLVFGLPALFVCAPIYAALKHYGHASYAAALAVGVGPAALIYLTGNDPKLAFWFTVYGAVVGLCTHYFAARSNNSFKPKPLRGSA